MQKIADFLQSMDYPELIWVIIGLFGQLMFSGRFIVQWIASERVRQSVIPIAFWYFSLIGGVVLLSYAIHRRDPIFILGQSIGLIVYIRNLWLIYRGEPKAKPPAPDSPHA